MTTFSRTFLKTSIVATLALLPLYSGPLLADPPLHLIPDPVGGAPWVSGGPLPWSGPAPCFTENLGQHGEGAGLLYTMGATLSAAFEPGLVRYALRGIDGVTSVFEVALEGSNPVAPGGVDPLGHRTDFFLGRDPEGWVRGASSYKGVRYASVYDRVDLEFRYDGDALKYEFVVAPGGDVSDIRMRYEGVDGLAVDGATGDLLVDLPSGALRDLAPCSYQPLKGARGAVGSAYVLLDERTVAFTVEDYDRRLPLVVDPGLVSSTLIGSSARDAAASIFEDGDGCVWLTGMGSGADFPTTLGAYRTEFSGGEAVVVKLDANLSTLLYSSFIGGWGVDSGLDLHVDDEGLVHLVGYTGSDDLPATKDAFCSTLGGVTDLFVATLDVDRSELVHCTYLGGGSYESAGGFHFDGSGRVHLSGATNSTDFPTTAGSFDGSFGGGRTDAFLVVYDLTTGSLNYSTLLGGAGDDTIADIHVDGVGDVYMCGETTSGSFPTTQGAYDTTFGGATDVFVLKLNVSSSSLDYSTFLGGSALDEVGGIVVDGKGCAYVAGDTFNPDFPTTVGAYDRYLDSWSDLFVLKLGWDGSTVLNSTFLGDEGVEEGAVVKLDAKGGVYVAGVTYSSKFPVTGKAFDGTFGGERDAVVARLDASLTNLEYATYLGGADEEDACDINVDTPGSLLLAGRTRSRGFPTTPGAYGTSLNGPWEDIFALRMDIDPPVLVDDLSPRVATTGDPYRFNATLEDGHGVDWVEVQYWFGADDPGFAMRCQLVSGSASNGTWSAAVDVPDGSLDDLHYRVTASDAAENTVATDVRDVDVIDDDPPAIGKDASPDVAETDLAYTFGAEVEDNVGLAAVWVEYWYGDGPGTNGTMAPTGGTVWEHWMVVDATLEALHYVLGASDASGNVARTTECVVDVVDVNGPVIVNEGTARIATTGDPFEFTLTAGDNVGVRGVTVWYAFEGDEPEPAEMEVVAAWPSGNVLVSLSIDVPSDAAGNITYWLVVEDLYGNVLTTHEECVRIVDDDDPTILGDGTAVEAQMGSPYDLRVTVADNVGVGAVEVECVLGGAEPATVTLEPGGNGSFHRAIEVPANALGPLRYRFRVVDLARNELWGEWHEVPVLDGIPPEIIGVSWGHPLKGLDLAVTLDAVDNAGAVDASLEYWFGEGDPTSVDMDEDLEATLPIPRRPGGDLHMVLTARDGSGNLATSEETVVELVNSPPRAPSELTWELVEEVPALLDLAGDVTDANDAPGDLVVTCDSMNVSVDGLVLGLTYDAWVPDHLVLVNVSDGEDAVTVRVIVTVVNVNDAPVIVDVSPWSGSSYPEGGAIELWANATDEDGDELTYTWLADGNVIGTGPTLRYADLPPGRHPVTLVVSDGEAVSDHGLEVVVEEGSGWTWATLVTTLSVGVIVLSALFMVARWRRRARST